MLSMNVHRAPCDPQWVFYMPDWYILFSLCLSCFYLFMFWMLEYVNVVKLPEVFMFLFLSMNSSLSLTCLVICFVQCFPWYFANLSWTFTQYLFSLNKSVCWVLRMENEPKKKRLKLRWQIGLGSEETCWAYSQVVDRAIREERTEKWKEEEDLLQQVETRAAAGPSRTSSDRSSPDTQDRTPSIIKSSQVGRKIRKHTSLHTSVDLTSSLAPFLLGVQCVVRAMLHIFCTETRWLSNDFLEGWRCLWTRVEAPLRLVGIYSPSRNTENPKT